MVFKSPNPREVAVKTLFEVLDKKKSLKYCIKEELLSKLSEVDRSFLIEIIYGVLRNLYYIDWLLEPFLRKREKLSSLTINNIRTAIYQLIFTRIPDYAVVNEAVNIEKSFRGKPDVVNGVLRNFLRKYHDRKSLPEAESPSIKYSHPQWLVDRWTKRFGVEETERLLKANNQKPPFTLAVIPESREMVVEYLTKKGFFAKSTLYSPAGIVVEGDFQNILKTIKDAPFFWIVQDEASQLVTFLLQPKEGCNVLDLCASPGGKTLLTAALIKRGRIVSVEKNIQRFRLLKENIERLRKFLPQVEIKALLMDLFDLNLRENFDRVILDAPCSSTGVIRRNPDVRYRVTEEEIRRLSIFQTKMLEKGSKFVKKDGVIVYSVCSTEPEEGEEVVEHFLQKHSEFSSIDSVYSFFRDFYIKKGFFRCYPHKHGTDGFFMAGLLR